MSLTPTPLRGEGAFGQCCQFRHCPFRRPRLNDNDRERLRSRLNKIKRGRLHVTTIRRGRLTGRGFGLIYN